ncbi:flavin reductase family protein [Luteibaculum oceani]|nr:flavin reductase [Luteibaculum oceani]
MTRSIDSSEIKDMNKIFRLNLINSVTGFKSANLVGTTDKNGQDNLAVFSSVTHLGSNPAFVGLIVRPNVVPRHTYQNILETGKYTINAITNEMKARAHFTSAKFEKYQSEFDTCGFGREFSQDFLAPFVRESPIKMALSLKDDILIKANSTRLIVGEVEKIIIDDSFLHSNGMLDLARMDIQTISGLNRYHNTDKGAIFPYARPTEIPEFNYHEAIV